MFAYETSSNMDKKPSNRHKKGTIICCICGKEYIAEQRTLTNRRIRYGNDYCKDCTPRQYKMTKKHLERVKKLPHRQADPVKTYTIADGTELTGKRCIDKICYKCDICGTAVIRLCKYVKVTYSRYNKLICPDCAKKDMKPTEEDRQRGMENRRNNVMKKYGVSHVNQLAENRAKMSEIMKEKEQLRKVDWNTRHKKRDQTIAERYGNREEMYKQIAEKREATNTEKYGVKSTLSIPEVRDKIRETSLERYGVTVPSNNKESRLSSKIKGGRTFIDRYGYSSYWKTEAYRKVQHDRIRYRYDGIDFGTRWLLCFYIYYKELGKDISFEVPEYVYKTERGNDGKYKPDCIMNGKMYDIRGDEYYYGGKKYEAFEKSALYKFIESKGIKVVTLDEISMYYEYIEWRWGSLDYIDQFKVEE